MFNIELIAVAEDELADAYDWYEDQQTGLGNKFYNEVNGILNILEINPEQYPIKYPGEIHSAVLDKFPYLIIYWIDKENNEVIVLSIFHTSREPKQF